MRVRRATVIGAGVMGAGIAAQFANSGIPVWLLDVPSKEVTDEDRRAGREAGHPDVRNRLARAGRERVLRATPSGFMAPDLASLVTPGNVEDDLHHVRESDWVIEAVVENLAAKHALLEQVARHRQPGTIVSSNTSGLSISAMTEGRSSEFRGHFLGTHFFNPPRQMRLVEIIPTAATLPEVVGAAQEFIGRDLGKGLVMAKDTPNFIANRIGAFTTCLATKLAQEGGYTVEEVDLLTGSLIGRPRTGTFRLADLVGLDTAYHVRKNVYASLPHDPDREVFFPPAPLSALVERGTLGAKSGRGYYWRRGNETLVIDLATLEYRPQRPPEFPALDAIARIPDIGERISALLARDDRAGAYVWRLLSRTLVYTARVLPEISDDVVNVDRAMRWGYSWDLGPFELWDALGPARLAERLAKEGTPVPAPVEAAVRRGGGRFYRGGNGRREYFDAGTAAYRALPGEPGVLNLAGLARETRRLEHNAEASLLDLGDGVACVELHSKQNAIGAATLQLLETALDRLEETPGWESLVIGTQATHFSAGANLHHVLAMAEEGRWDVLDRAVRQFQGVTRRIRYAPKPVVVAPAGRALGGGAEFCLASAHVQAAAETYLGLVETLVGLIPAGGGTTEVVRRLVARIPAGVTVDLLPLVRWAFETIGRGTVSQSAVDARRLGYLRESDGITMDARRVLADAKAAALGLVRLGYRPPRPAGIRVGGERAIAALAAMLHIQRTGGYITPFDEVVGRRLAHVMAGGAVPEGTAVSEDYLHELEREAFLGLLGETRTRDRIRHMLDAGKPLRN